MTRQSAMLTNPDDSAPGHANFVQALRQQNRLIRVSIITVIVICLALFSIFLTRLANSAAVLWLPNAFCISALLLTLPRFRVDVLMAHFTGVVLANLLYGDKISVAFGFGVLNFVEVMLCMTAIRMALGSLRPHKNESTYLKFVFLACICTAIVSAIPSAVFLHFVYEAPILSAYYKWLIGSSVSLVAFVPLFYRVMGGSRSAGRGGVEEAYWTAACIGLTTVILILTVAVHEEVRGFFLMFLVFSLFALKQGVMGTVLVTAFFVFCITLSSFVEADALISPQNLGLGSEISAFATVFFCVAVPANLIAAMVERLETAERIQRDISMMKSQFISTMSHEIRTPMNAIHGMFELFARSTLTAKQEKWVEAGLSASRTLQHQVNQILELARLEENAIPLRDAKVNLRELLSLWVTSAEGQVILQGKEIKVFQKFSSVSSDDVIADRDRLNQVVLNLIGNAVKFSQCGSLEIEVSVSDSTFKVAIKDEGPGIAPRDQERIFERFAQVEGGATRKNDGAGLGLSISRELTRLMGGELKLTSRVGEGSTFEVVLPNKKEL